MLKINLKDYSFEYSKSNKFYSAKHLLIYSVGRYWLKGTNKIFLNNDIAKINVENKKELLKNLEGNYLILIFDSKDKSLEIYSDVTGSIALYYAMDNNYLICSTDLKLFQQEYLDIFRHRFLDSAFDEIKKIKSGYNKLNCKQRIFINIPPKKYKNFSLSDLL